MSFPVVGLSNFNTIENFHEKKIQKPTKTKKTKDSPLKWKIRSKMIFSDFLKDFFKKKINFEKFVEKWKNRLKNNFLRVSAGFLKGKNGLWKFCWKLKKSPKNHFFGLSAGFPKRKNGLWKIC